MRNPRNEELKFCLNIRTYILHRRRKRKIYMMEKINYCIRLTELKQILMEPDKTYVLKLIKYLGSYKTSHWKYVILLL